jgi:DNA-binding SARP family transcriptional activator
MNMGRLEDAENTLEEAFEIARKLSWKERFPDIETESGFLSLMKNDLDKAERFFERVEKRRNINKFLQGACNMGRSVLMRKKRNFEKALEYAEEDLKITESMGQGAMVGESLLNIAKIYLARGDFETALEYMEKAEPLLVKGHDNFVLDNLKLLRCIAKGGDVKQIIDKIEKKEYFGILLSDSDILYQYLNETKSALQKVVSIKTLGKFEVFVKNERVPYKKFRRKGVITFFKYLLSNFPKQISIDKISDDLYRHLDLKKAKHNIYVSVSVINKLFESYGVKEMILRAQGMYGLNPGVIKSIDFIEFTELARKSKFKEMVNLYKGAFLEENMYDDWTMQIRDYISGLYVNALSNLAEKEKGAKKEVLLKKLLEADPLNEEAAKSLLAYYIDNGNKSAAISFYEKIKKIYEEDYGMDLPGGIVSLFERI